MIVVVPAISLAAGAGIAVLASAFRALAVAALLALVGLSGLQLARWYTLPQKEDWRAATHYILGQQRPGD